MDDCVSKTYLQYENNVHGIYKAKMTYEHLKFLRDLVFGRQSSVYSTELFFRFLSYRIDWSDEYEAISVIQNIT